MTQWIKTLAIKPDDLSSVPGTYSVEGENSLLKSPDFHMCAVAQAHLLIHTCTFTRIDYLGVQYYTIIFLVGYIWLEHCC